MAEPTPDAWDGQDILALLDLVAQGTDSFRNRCNHVNTNGALFGGQVLGQGLRAAILTVPGRAPHSLHGYFVRPGSGDRIVAYRVERTRDGKSFSTRRVTAIQDGKPIFHMDASFHTPEEGLSHQARMPDGVPRPETLRSLDALARDWVGKLDADILARLPAYPSIDLRLTDPERPLLRPAETPECLFWTRIPTSVTDDAGLQACALAYASDFWLSAATRAVHGRSPAGGDVLTASLDHAMWFHGPVRADRWHLYQTDSPWAGHGRGLARGLLFDEAGTLVASTAQEVLLRRMPKR